MISIDGSMGEGGGQVLRTSLALSMVTGTPFVIENIRGNRKKPGLLRQHLTAVRAAAAVSCAQVVGGELGSSRVGFTPTVVNAGDYRFSIGSAGSTTLVLQTILPALMLAERPSTITIEGGTHNSFAPTERFLTRCFLPVLASMGPRVEVELVRHGFFPGGGGRIEVQIDPCVNLNPIELVERAEIVSKRAIASVAGLSVGIAERELRVVAKKLGWGDPCLEIEELGERVGPGNVLSIELESATVTEVITGFGERGVSAEAIAQKAAKRAHAYISSGVPVGPYLADQLLIPLALAGGGAIKTGPLTRHTETNMEVIGRFLPSGFQTDEVEPGRYLIACGAGRK